jgi:hypothetical protein
VYRDNVYNKQSQSSVDAKSAEHAVEQGGSMTYPQRSNSRGYPRDTPRIRLRSSAADLGCITVTSAHDYEERA